MDLSQQAISDGIGVPKSRFAKWEERGTIPKKEDFDRVTSYLGNNVVKYPALKEFLSEAKPYGQEEVEANLLQETGAVYVNKSKKEFIEMSDGKYIMNTP